MVIAHESNPAAREILAKLIELNGVTKRVTPRGLIEPTDLSGLDGRRVLLICDIEGGEIDLLSGYDLKRHCFPRQVKFVEGS